MCTVCTYMRTRKCFHVFQRIYVQPNLSTNHEGYIHLTETHTQMHGQCHYSVRLIFILCYTFAFSLILIAERVNMILKNVFCNCNANIYVEN